MSDTQEWRLQATPAGSGGLGELVKRLSGGEEVLGTRVGALPLGVDLTHDGDTLFAYAPSKATVDRARSAIAAALSATGREAAWRVCRWDEELDEWRQIEPPLDDAARERKEARVAAARRHETRTFTCTTGRFAREVVEAGVLDYASRQGIDCTVAEERHLFQAQLAFTASGPAFKLADLEQFAHQEARRMQMDYGPSGA
jgi:hypothetical protein